MRLLMLGVVALAACDTASDGRVDELETTVRALAARVDALEAENVQLRASQQAQQSSLNGYAETLAGADALLAYVSVDDAGDVIVEGANLRVRSGSGATAGAVNGKGNVIVGYDEPLELGTCSGGGTPGATCQGDFACGGGTCTNKAAASVRTGSHNLVVGDLHSYENWGGLIAGSGNVVSGAYASVLGGAGNVADQDGEIVP
jgi:outer membrane murein-binding lipoprotein Lpp